jgi:methionyl-tRNA formyltransferase
MKMKITLITNSKAERIDDILNELKKFGEVEIIKDKIQFMSMKKQTKDIIISDRAEFIFPAEFIKDKLIINSHPSLLPKHRGSFPLFWACILGDRTGISIHEVDEGVDTGGVLYQAEFKYSDSQTFREVHDISRNLIINGFKNILNKIKNGEKLNLNNFKEDKFSDAHKKTDTYPLLNKLPKLWDTKIKDAKIILQNELAYYKRRNNES